MDINIALSIATCKVGHSHEFAGGNTCIYCGVSKDTLDRAEDVIEMTSLSGEGVYSHG